MDTFDEMVLDDSTVGVFEAMGTARAMRWLKPDPVPWPLVEKVLWAATRATNPNNQQPWDFVVVDDPSTKARIGELMASLLPPSPRPLRPDLDPVTRRTVIGGMNLIANLGEAPVLVFICGSDVSLHGEIKRNYTDSALYAAAQNLIVAARAIGLGATFTTLHERIEPDLRDLLDIPADRYIAVTMPLGWPARSFGPLTRKPLLEVVHRNHWNRGEL